MNLYAPRRRKRRCLIFSPLAWLKFQFLCHLGPTEVGAFAISDPKNPLYISTLMTVPQETTVATVKFDDTAVANYFDQCVDQGLKPAQFARLWLHSHPGDSALPSGVDEETFLRVFGTTDWAVMAILSRAGRTYARLQVNAGPGASCRLRCRVDWKSFPQELDEGWYARCLSEWLHEYEQNVHHQALAALTPATTFNHQQAIKNISQFQEMESWYGDPSWPYFGEYPHDFASPRS